MRTFIMIMSFILFAATVHSQNKPELKTNAKDTLTISEMFTTAEGIRMYKIAGLKYAYETYAVNVTMADQLTLGFWSRNIPVSIGSLLNLSGPWLNGPLA